MKKQNCEAIRLDINGKKIRKTIFREMGMKFGIPVAKLRSFSMV